MSILVAPALIVNADRVRHGLRAPRGGCVVAGKFYRGGCFCLPFDETNPHERPVVEIKGASYVIEPTDPGSTYSAVKLRKRVSGETHEVIRHEDGRLECDCKGHFYRGTCRHVEAATNLLPAPIVEAVNVENTVIETPAPLPAHERPVTPFVAGLILDHQEDRVAAVALPLIERHRTIHESGPASPEALGWSARSAWGRMDSEDRRSFIEWCRAIVYQPGQLDGATSPEDRWEFFVAECRDGSPLDMEADDYRPEPPTFAPSVEEEGEWLEILDQEEDPAYHAWLDQLAAERMDDAFALAGPRESDPYPPGYTS